MSLDSLRFQQILQDAKTRKPSGTSESLVVNAHMAQMRLFMTRQGIEFFPRQDTFGMRREFIRRVVDWNQLPSRLERIIDNFLIDGRGLFYLRPSKDLYRIHYFTSDQYRTYYNEDGDLEEVQIIYSFKVRSGLGSATALNAPSGSGLYGTSWGPGSQENRWVSMRVFADRIEQTISIQQPNFDSAIYGVMMGQTTTYVNTLGFVPAVEVFNNRGLTEAEGTGEFDWLSSHILEHDRMTRTIRRNLQFFGTPTLVSSRPRQDLIEPTDGAGDAQRATVASNSGFIGLRRGSTRSSDPSLFNSQDGGIRVPRLIANVEAADRVQYISPDPVPGDLTGYAAQYQEMIRAALGGVDDLSISSGATAYEVRTLYGRVSATAKRKCRDLYEYGLCRLFSMMIAHEEHLFRKSFASRTGLVEPAPVIEEELPPESRNPEVIAQLKEKYDRAMQSWNMKVSQGIRAAQEAGEFPEGLIGLIPDGDTRVDWRFMGDVFEESSQELLQQSIITRNLQELGVSSIEALQYLFPNKTPEERAAMLGGYPFRVVEATQRSLGIFLDMMRGLYQVPHPSRPDLPMAADPSLNLVPYLYNALSFLQRELSYSGSHSNADTASQPPTLSDADRARAERGIPTELERDASRRRDEFRSAAARVAAQSGLMGTGVPGADRGRPAGSDSDALFPAGGGVLAFDPAGPYTSANTQLGAPGQPPAAGGPGGIRLGAADLLAPSNAGVPGGDAFAVPGGGAPGPARTPGGGKQSGRR